MIPVDKADAMPVLYRCNNDNRTYAISAWQAIIASWAGIPLRTLAALWPWCALRTRFAVFQINLLSIRMIPVDKADTVPVLYRFDFDDRTDAVSTWDAVFPLRTGIPLRALTALRPRHALRPLFTL